MNETDAGRSGTPLDRRAFLGLTGISVAAFTLGIAAPADAAAATTGPVPADPFQLGVASGDPEPTSVVLWTRLAPRPLAEDGHGAPTDDYTELWLSNPHVKFYDGRRGYVRCTMTPESLTSDYRVVDYIRRDDQAPVSTIATFVTEAGRPGLAKVTP